MYELAAAAALVSAVKSSAPHDVGAAAGVVLAPPSVDEAAGLAADEF